MDDRFASLHSIPLNPKPFPRPLHLIDGQPISSGAVTHDTKLSLQVGPHFENTRVDICRLDRYPLVLGITWLRQHNPLVDWRIDRVTFTSPYCSRYCLANPAGVRALPVVEMAQTGSSAPLSPPGSPSVSQAEVPPPALDFDQLLSRNHRVRPVAYIHATGISEPAHLPDPPEYIAQLHRLVPPEYHDLLAAFSKANADQLPRHRKHDHAIETRPGTEPPFGPIYSMSEEEASILRGWLTSNLEKGFIRPSVSPAGAPILFSKKKGGDLRVCHDYRGLNDITIKNRMPLPLISDTLDRLRGAKVFTKLDLRGAYNLVRIRDEDVWKTAFRTRYGLFETLVLPFGLTNAPATFQALINETLRDLLDITVLVYLDDILVFSTDPTQHTSHVREVLQRLIREELYVNAEKCQFRTTETEYLGYTISTSGVAMSRDKVEAVLDWPRPTNVKELQQFLGFANFYRRFIKGYSRLIQPMTRLLKKGAKFDFDPAAIVAFEQVKTAFTSAPVLQHYDPALPTRLEVDASDGAISGILSQTQPDKSLHPIAFMSRKMTPAERNYGIGEKELLAIIHSVRVWRHYLEGLRQPFEIYSDHKNLEYFRTARVLTRRQARWSEHLNSHKYILIHRPGEENGKADALSRRPDLIEGGKAAEATAETLLRPLRLWGTTPRDQGDTPTLLDRIREATTTDEALQDRIARLNSPDPTNDPEQSHYETRDGLLYYQGRLCVPNSNAIKISILQIAHDGLTTGHPGREKTLKLVARDYHWPGMGPFIREFVRTCARCQRTKAPRHAPYGLLQPLPIPQRPWLSISLDHIVELPPSRGHNAILVVVDRHSKMAHFIPANTTDTAATFARQFIDRVFRLHGLPADIVSDRGPIFRSRWWKEVLRSLRVTPNMSTAHHPQSDGQTERVNQILEQYLRTYCDYLQDDWCDLLPLAEFAYNNAPQASTGDSPFYLNYGYHPRAEFTTHDSTVPAANDHVKSLQQAHATAREAIARAQATYAKNADKNRKPAPEFAVGDLVRLRRLHLRSQRPSQKLDDRFLGPFPVAARVGNVAYRLTLPKDIRCWPVFHSSLLEPWNANTMDGRTQLPPPAFALDNDGNEEWEVEAILDSRWRRVRRQRVLEYFVHWTGFGPEDRSWVPADEFHDDDRLPVAFHRAHPDRPVTPSRKAAANAAP
jgi:hypothetical protein